MKMSSNLVNPNALEAKGKGTQIMDTVVGSSPTQRTISLPSEAARALAGHIIDTYDDIQVPRQSLARVIQEYWDGLP